jgi:hypothetical protein
VGNPWGLQQYVVATNKTILSPYKTKLVDIHSSSLHMFYFREHLVYPPESYLLKGEAAEISFAFLALIIVWLLNIRSYKFLFLPALLMGYYVR